VGDLSCCDFKMLWREFPRGGKAPSLSRRAFLAATAAAAARPVSAAPVRRAADPLLLNDASKLNPTPVARNTVLRPDGDAALIADLRALLKDAATENLPVCVGGARHSMGGQALMREGVAASLATPSIEVDTARRTMRVRAGTRWRDVIAALDPKGFSPAVTQSNHDFSVGGTLSVNAHGWPVPYGPFGATVRSFRLMLADGSLVMCSRTENAELFELAIGGYGLLGIVVDAEVEVADNVLLRARPEVMGADAFAPRFVSAAREAGVRMAYGRLSVGRENYLGESLLVSYRPAAKQPTPLPPPRTADAFHYLSRRVFRAQTGSEAAKKRRWYLETVVGPRTSARKEVTRNAILNIPVSALADTDARRTDILHEYFVPPERFAEFLVACREIIPPSGQELLNVTIRWLEPDTTSVLSFAPQARIALVMLFPQLMTADSERSMHAMTEKLIDRVLSVGGSYYLPYRLHARGDQLRKAYPRIEEFIQKKRSYDPQLRFRNTMWETYLA
jgi:FAD/FMN-containing dehydrogenase